MGQLSASPHWLVILLLLILSYDKMCVVYREEMSPELRGKGPECALEAPI